MFLVLRLTFSLGMKSYGLSVSCLFSTGLVVATSQGINQLAVMTTHECGHEYRRGQGKKAINRGSISGVTQ